MPTVEKMALILAGMFWFAESGLYGFVITNDEK